jgi:pSer/pThr/pTyr-binding forkhead associated (FHA) protein
MGVPPQKAPEPAKPQMPNVAPMSSTVSVPVSAPVIPPMPQAPVQPVMPQQAPSQPMANANFGETTVLGVNNNIGETTVLGLASVNTEVKAYLVRTKNNERIIIDKPVFRIGKEKSYVDYFISDNTAISRSHANVVTKDGKYYIVDTNSTNHTYINNTMLQSNVETELTHGTRIKLANEEFEFILA